MSESIYLYQGYRNIDILFTIIDDKLSIVEHKVILEIHQDFIDEITDIGTHLVQIKLWDNGNGRVTLPPVNFEVLAPIF